MVSPSELLALLLGAATDAGVAVRTEPFVTTSRRGGGLIRLRGRSVVVLDENASPAERAATLAEALAECDLDHRRVAPAAWEQIVRARARSERAHHELAASSDWLLRAHGPAC